jgi:hypothetical protein
MSDVITSTIIELVDHTTPLLEKIHAIVDAKITEMKESRGIDVMTKAYPRINLFVDEDEVMFEIYRDIAPETCDIIDGFILLRVVFGNRNAWFPHKMTRAVKYAINVATSRQRAYCFNKSWTGVFGLYADYLKRAKHRS